jgi:hypothetical protein
MFHASKVDFDKYCDKLMSLKIDTDADLFWCPTPDCTYAFDNSEKRDKLCCPKCFKDYCLICDNKWSNGHENLINCRRLRATTVEEKAFFEWTLTFKARQCPYCK